MNTTMIRCTCCQAELTAPQFYNGNPYGYTCIKKVDPSYKRTKTVYLAMEAFKLISDPATSTRHIVNVKHNGKWQQIVCYGDIQSRTTTTYMQNDVLFVAEDKVK